ncbi:LacI family transcriptional regulator [Dactylosporangium fulvum]|uniref:LacI family transcriptional regulator n=2 Tax=Dactylosporangium fulvum TaxID=53359 RepID=A0ABY5W4U3_9ACTN|nr:LacI family DNA-binding transcriptional regulator [Dactylosporangium fulvum]UWP84395.1 LacI family transcriptional regulator [Dactylosporangium fulvum]
MVGVSQTTVSLVLTNNSEAASRIAPETRDRVERAIRETGYVADPLARRMTQQHNQILGVFTYELVFPSEIADFYQPFLSGLEACAERLGCDLLLFTSAPVNNGTRRILHENNRLRLADGCLLLGREMPREELARLIADGYPFVAVGRRDDAYDEADPALARPRPVPYVGADYTAATAALVRRARDLGHRRMAYVGNGSGAESAVDRLAGFRQAAPDGAHVTSAGRGPAEVLDEVVGAGVTVVFCEELAVADELVKAAEGRGITVPDRLSVAALGDVLQPRVITRDFTTFHIPRHEMGWQAVEVLTDMLYGSPTDTQRLLPCELSDGRTLAPPLR